MRRSAILVVVLFAMLWQSIALARVGSAPYPLADLEHAALHWLDENHHHHEDGSYHLDSSPESVQHALSDHGSGSMALVAMSRTDEAPSFGASLVHAVLGTPAPNPFLDGLLRPPRIVD
jgi:hypothetical protein